MALLYPTFTHRYRAAAAQPGALEPVTHFDNNNISSRVVPAGSWGTIRRNSAYVGPALRVEDNGNPGTFVDINFDPDGRVRGARPYGDNTRVVTLYDQFGTSDFIAFLGDDILVREDGDSRDGGPFDTWRLSFPGGAANGMTTSGSLTNGSQPWELGTLAWAVSIIRPGFQDYGTQGAGVFGVTNGSTTHREYHLGIERQSNGDESRFFWEINNGGNSNWGDDTKQTHPSQVQTFQRVMGDLTQADNIARGYINNVEKDQLAFTPPIVYTAGQPLRLAVGLSQTTYKGDMIELNIFDHVGAFTAGDLAAIDAALDEAYNVYADAVIVREQRAYGIMGSTGEGIAVNDNRAYGIMGSTGEGVAAREQLLYAIIVP